jgi:hypothetical protein
LRDDKHSLSNPPSIKKEKVSFREPLCTEDNRSEKTLLLNNNTFDAEKSDYVRPTIVETCNTSKLPTIASEEEEEKTEEIHQTIEEEVPKTCKSPIVEQVSIPIAVENNTKRRTTRRTTTRLFRESQNGKRLQHPTSILVASVFILDNIPLQPSVEFPTKTRYATRYSTRLAAGVINEEITTSRTSTIHRRTTRFASE